MKKKAKIFLFGILILLFAVFLFYFSGEQEQIKVAPLAQTEKGETQQADNTNIAIEKSIISKQDGSNRKGLLNELSKTSALPKIELTLHQVIFDEEKKSGYAIISYQGASHQVYIVGSELSKGVTLARLFKGGIEIDNHGSLEKHYTDNLTASRPPQKKMKSTLSAAEQEERVRLDFPPSLKVDEIPPSSTKLSPSLSPTIPDDGSPPPPSGGLTPRD